MSQLTSAVTNIALVMVSLAATPCSLMMWAKVEFSGPAAQMELPETVPASSWKSITAHSDSGSQYGSGAYRQLQAKAGMRQSISVRANPYHNAWTEPLMGTLKTEMRQDGRFIEGSHARTDAFEYIEAYYNTRRKHSALGYQTPAQFEVQIHSLNQTTIGPEIRCISFSSAIRGDFTGKTGSSASVGSTEAFMRASKSTAAGMSGTCLMSSFFADRTIR